jgi:hypothetical protein
MTGTAVCVSTNQQRVLSRPEIQALRDRARRLREIASVHIRSPVTPDLLDMAAAMEERASDLEHEQAARNANP